MSHLAVFFIHPSFNLSSLNTGQSRAHQSHQGILGIPKPKVRAPTRVGIPRHRNVINCEIRSRERIFICAFAGLEKLSILQWWTMIPERENENERKIYDLALSYALSRVFQSKGWHHYRPLFTGSQRSCHNSDMQPLTNKRSHLTSSPVPLIRLNPTTTKDTPELPAQIRRRTTNNECLTRVTQSQHYRLLYAPNRRYFPSCQEGALK